MARFVLSDYWNPKKSLEVEVNEIPDIASLEIKVEKECEIHIDLEGNKLIISVYADPSDDEPAHRIKLDCKKFAEKT